MVELPIRWLLDNLNFHLLHIVYSDLEFLN